MPAMLEDPTAPAVYRTSGEPPYPAPGDPLPAGIVPRQVTLRDRVTVATLMPFTSHTQVPIQLLAYLCHQFGLEIEKGDTYPMTEPLSLTDFGPYWFGRFGAIMLLGNIQSVEELDALAQRGHDWEKACLGSFYIKPNYPGRSSHVCNGGFLVTDAVRNRGVGRLMGEMYLQWAPKLGYTYSVFNLVYETNVVSCRIWDALGFKRIGRVKGCGSLRSYPGELIDAIIYGRDLGHDDDLVPEERFEKIRFYLKNGNYPAGADRAEKSRLRSAATHYKLVPAEGDQPEKLMLKGKEVISDPQRQYDVAREIHLKSHGGINKTTAAIAEAYHWVRIKETVNYVIRNCPECSEMNKHLTNSRTPLTPSFSLSRPPLSTNTALSSTPDTATGTSARQQQAREESPSSQLQAEAAQAHQQGPYNAAGSYPGFDMPVDPALMEENSNLEDLPPSPFLAANRSVTVQQTEMTDMDLPDIPELPTPITRTAPDDVTMSGTRERAPTASKEIQRRLKKAGLKRKR
ncbi:hypothetical protein M011DRAFT_471248 [Sporormia fimetaria CBS 119925]|uniref:N-acetyltransferase domain-containing protein n=1 Tax=Sporormia fimetaria CBS 119925 TaxID=1340428 RepID=A0A6A6V324_9PLEO|nr:hypothetical protein M011DRAFT_471248 [Sporormia fimetaria CBS 119925]